MCVCVCVCVRVCVRWLCVLVTVVGNRPGDLCTLHSVNILWKRMTPIIFPSSYGYIVGYTEPFNIVIVTGIEKF